MQSGGYYKAWVNLRSYPILLLLFSAGLAALAADNYPMLAALLIKPQNKYANAGKEPLILSVFPYAVIDDDIGRLLPDMDKRRTPASDYLVDALSSSSPLREYIPEQEDLEDKFDRLEYLISLSIIDNALQTSSGSWAPIGRFGWRFRRSGNHYISSRVQNELDTEKENWKPLKAGFLGGSLERAIAAQNGVIEILKRVPWW